MCLEIAKPFKGILRFPNQGNQQLDGLSRGHCVLSSPFGSLNDRRRDVVGPSAAVSACERPAQQMARGELQPMARIFTLPEFRFGGWSVTSFFLSFFFGGGGGLGPFRWVNIKKW